MSPRRAASVLLVDDQPENLLALEAVLKPLGLRTVRATSGEQALRRLLDEDFAAILLDVRMPDMDGFETAELVRARPASHSTPILFVTAFPERLLTGEALEPAFVVTKPFDSTTLKVAISQALFFAKSE